jgi:hypothetical protein
MDPDQFIAWAKTQDPQDIADQLYDHADTLTNGSRSVFKNAMWALLRHGGNINMPDLENDYEVENQTRGYTPDEIHRIIGLLDDDLHKLLIYVAKDTGLRIRTILKLTYAHFKDDLEIGKDTVRVNLPKKFYQSSKSASLTFIGPETVEQFKLCLQPHRKETTKTVDEKKVKTKETYVPIDKDKLDEPIFKMRYSAAYDFISIALRKANISDETINPYGSFRMFYTNAFRLPNVNDYEIDALTGHHANTVILKYYFERGPDSIEKLREIYRRAYPSLRVNIDKATAQTQQTQEQEIKDLKEQVAKLQEYYNDLLRQGQQALILNQKETAKVASRPTEQERIDEILQMFGKKYNLPKEVLDVARNVLQNMPPALRSQTEVELKEGTLSAKTWFKLLQAA